MAGRSNHPDAYINRLKRAKYSKLICGKKGLREDKGVLSVMLLSYSIKN